VSTREPSGGTAPATAHPEAYPDRPVSESIQTITQELNFLVRAEIALAKAELRQSAKAGATGAATFAVAAVAVFLVLLLGSIAAAYGLVAAGWDPWAGFLLVTGVWVVVAAVGALVGRSRLRRVTGPERAVGTAKEMPDAIVPGRTPAPPKPEDQR
jgi:hypothetical protein